MTQFPPVSRQAKFVALLGCLIALPGACGGDTKDFEYSETASGGQGDASGTGGSGPTDSGSGGRASSGGFPGASAGGADAGEGGSDPGGMAGEGGASSAICSQPLVTGVCQALFYRIGYSSELGRCTAFQYGGCGANDNNFVTLKECDDLCNDGERSPMDECLTDGDCVLVPNGQCCRSCDEDGKEDFLAVNFRYRDSLWDENDCSDICYSCEPDTSKVTVKCENKKCIAYEE